MTVEPSFFDAMDAVGAAACHAVRDRASGLSAFILIHDTTLGPAAGGIRTWRYASEIDALRDAAALASAMTVKCALAGLPAGGGKAVVLDGPDLVRPDAFARLGEAIDVLGGRFLTAGDLGTGPADLAAVATATRHVCTREQELATSVASGLARCLQATAALHGKSSLHGLCVAVQGCGSIGRAVARALAGAGAVLWVADVDVSRAEALAREVGGRACPAADVLHLDVDVLSPCAIGAVITEAVARNVRAFAICGAANNALDGDGTADILARRGILHVPDPIASAGGVIAGLAELLPGTPPAAELIDRLGITTREVLEESLRTGRPPSAVALARAHERIERARRAPSLPS